MTGRTRRLTPRAAALGAAAMLGVLASVASCDADLRELQRDQCLVTLNGICDEPDLCAEGSDQADCHPGPYGACHSVFSLFSNARCEAFEFCSVLLQSFPITASTCVPICQVDADCPPAAVAGEVVCSPAVAVSESTLVAFRNGCVILCEDEFDCFEGQICNPSGICMWPTPEGASF